MRITTWNCCRGPWNRKAPLLERLGSDIAVIQECPKVDELPGRRTWIGDNPKLGLAVQVSGKYSLARLTLESGAPRYVLPLRVYGPIEFVLIAVWAQRDEKYVEGVVRSISVYEDLIRGAPTVLVGDLNSNAIWDKDHPSELNHTSLVDRLSKLGLVSCYHSMTGENHGEESRPTFYFQRNKAKPFHIDYCFIPMGWLPYLRAVEVGEYEDWSGSSDHRPLLVDLDDSLDSLRRPTLP